MYWQKRLDRTASTQIIEEEIQAIRKKHQHYGYRRMTQELKLSMAIQKCRFLAI
ncbi:hypothetical protein MXE74_13855 [Enterococcus faecalis]|uniref:hypothetical protein n=1 Tax=Enterococcus faecalis TaxID=1351 RepID=UPI002DB57161|nr:hypothetical protein [Enterococcus faecalis]MEB5927619.1 hypothetical protein [Enterococcus faecalis]